MTATQTRVIVPIFDQQTPAAPKLGGMSLEVETLCRELLDFAQDNSKHIPLAGMAANQVSVDGERCLLNACFIRQPDGWLTALNPEIVKTKGASFLHRERCMTWRGNKVVWAQRWSEVTIKYMKLDGTWQENDVAGWEAIVWQHEVNHLDGVPEDIHEPIKAGVKIGANDPCPCKSGKKFKKCCGRL